MAIPPDLAVVKPPRIKVPDPKKSPVLEIKPDELNRLGQKLQGLFNQYVSDRRIAELKWLRSLRQYLGIYDPDIEKELSPNRSRAYPRITRVKCVSVLARLMNLMFQGTEKNWELKAGPSPDMKPEDVMEAIMRATQEAQEDGDQPEITDDFVKMAVQKLADRRCAALVELIDDQMQEIGGDQTMDYVALNRAVIKSGIMYGPGVLQGPFARESKTTTWTIDPNTKQPVVKSKTSYKPMFEFCPVWDFYPDMSAKTFAQMDGYFTRKVMSRTQVLALADREDFFAPQIKK